MRRSRRAFACRRGSTRSGCRNGGAQGRNFWARSASCFPAKNRADPKDWRVAMPIDRAEPGVPAPLALAATYTREVRVGIDRIWENVLDWEHLPALHEVYFDHVRIVETGNLGWRVELTKTPGSASRWMLLELRIDRANARYCARTLEGDGAEQKFGLCWRRSDRSGRQSRCAFICPSVGRKGSAHSVRNTGRATRVSGTRTRQ